ncbi:MAG: 50S ribosomal protein L17 [Candidatus Omnitrophica bacterium]|nr:50S ribosomal protein L17 [Candidatus Omnitrophota bacterium]
MRHAKALNRLSRSSAPRKALVAHMAKNVLRYGRVRTTLTKAKQCQRVIDRLISVGKDGSIHARRQAYRLLQNRELVKHLFAEVAPRFLDCQGGYTRVLKLSPRLGDGAPEAMLELTRLPLQAAKAQPSSKTTPHGTSPAPASPTPKKEPAEEEAKKPKRFFEGLREWFQAKKGNPSQD